MSSRMAKWLLPESRPVPSCAAASVAAVPCAHMRGGWEHYVKASKILVGLFRLPAVSGGSPRWGGEP